MVAHLRRQAFPPFERRPLCLCSSRCYDGLQLRGSQTMLAKVLTGAVVGLEGQLVQSLP